MRTRAVFGNATLSMRVACEEAVGRGTTLLLMCIGACILAGCGDSSAPAATADHAGAPLVAEERSVHMLIPAGPGGGWDGTARAVGAAMTSEGLISHAAYENLSGGGGGRAIARLIEAGPRSANTLLVNSTPIVVRSLQGIFPQSFRDLTPVAALIADYGTFAVRADSPLQSFEQLVATLADDPGSVLIGGGSVRGNMDHLVAAWAVRSAGGDPRALRYVPYDAGGKALTAVLGGEVAVASTGLGEALELVRGGQLRLLAVTAPERLAVVSEVPTLQELGIDMTFANWRGFFAAPGIAPTDLAQQIDRLQQLSDSPSWAQTRRRFGWEPLFLAGDDFHDYLVAQETSLRQVLTELGFLQ